MNPLILLLTLVATAPSFAASTCHATFAEFSKVNAPGTGLVVKSVKDWFTAQDIEAIKAAYPQPAEKRHGKIVVFASQHGSGEKSHFELYPEFSTFYQSQPALRTICEKMRQELLQSLPAEQRKTWEKKKWSVALQWSDGTQAVEYDHVSHVHRDSVVATLTMEGSGTIVKIPERDIAKLNNQQIYEEGDKMPGLTYQAAPGDLVLLDGVHHPGGGLHAAPQSDGNSPSRLVVLVGIEE